MSNYLLALLLSIFLASAGGVSYFQKHPEHRHAVKTFVNTYFPAHSEKEDHQIPKHGGGVAHETPSHGGVARAPEINASSGTNAMAILIGVLLLASERYRANRR